MPVSRHTELLEKHMRILIALTFCFLLAVPQVQACLHPGDFLTLFFQSIPDPPPDADVIATVSLSDVKGDYPGPVTATIMQVLKASDARVYPGAKMTMQVNVSSCGPSPRNGDEGTIIAKLATDNKGRPVLCPYMRSRRGHIDPPIMSDESISDHWRDRVGCPSGKAYH